MVMVASQADQAEAVVVEVARTYGVTPAALRGRERTMEMVEARAVVARLLNEQGRTSVQIGRALARHHSTILHHLERFDGRGPEAAEVLDDCRRALRRAQR